MPRRIYDLEFKTSAIKLVTEQGYKISEAAKSLGVSSKSIRDWVKLHHNPNGQRSKYEIEQELRQLKEENKRLRMERDILKKATTFFAKESK